MANVIDVVIFVALSDFRTSKNPRQRCSRGTFQVHCTFLREAYVLDHQFEQTAHKHHIGATYARIPPQNARAFPLQTEGPGGDTIGSLAPDRKCSNESQTTVSMYARAGSGFAGTAKCDLDRARGAGFQQIHQRGRARDRIRANVSQGRQVPHEDAGTIPLRTRRIGAFHNHLIIASLNQLSAVLKSTLLSLQKPVLPSPVNTTLTNAVAPDFKVSLGCDELCSRLECPMYIGQMFVIVRPRSARC